MLIAIVKHLNFVRRCDAELCHCLLRKTRDRNNARGSAPNRWLEDPVSHSEHETVAFRYKSGIDVMNADDVFLYNKRPGVAQTKEAPAQMAGQDELLPKMARRAWQQAQWNVDEW